MAILTFSDGLKINVPGKAEQVRSLLGDEGGPIYDRWVLVETGAGPVFINPSRVAIVSEDGTKPEAYAALI